MRSKTLASFALVTALVGATGCVVRARATGRVYVPPPPRATVTVEIEEKPPQPQVWVTEVRPGFVFVQGRWHRQGGRWVWHAGHWERTRANQMWVDGRWERRGRGHVWVEGRWEAGGRVDSGPDVRDHRRNDPPPPAPGPDVRDHRH